MNRCGTKKSDQFWLKIINFETCFGQLVDSKINRVRDRGPEDQRSRVSVCNGSSKGRSLNSGSNQIKYKIVDEIMINQLCLRTQMARLESGVR